MTALAIMLNNYCWLFLTNALGIKLFPDSRSRKEKPWEWGLSRELPDRSNSDNFLRMWTMWGATSPFFPLQVAANLLGLRATMVVRLLLLKTTTDLGRGERKLVKLNCHKTPCSYWDSAVFFLNKDTPWIVVIVWLISRVLKKLTLTLVANVPFAYIEKWILRGPYSTIPEALLQMRK